MNRIGHVAVNTPDLDRFRAFYEDVIGIRCAVVLRMTEGPLLRHAFFHVDDHTLLHVFEVPGYDPTDDGYVQEIGRRGRIDHFAFLVADEGELEAARQRLVAAGASDGTLTDWGPVLSVYFEDPDGMPCEVTAVNPAYDPAAMPRETFLEVADPAWFDRLRNSMAPAAAV